MSTQMLAATIVTMVATMVVAVLVMLAWEAIERRGILRAALNLFFGLAVLWALATLLSGCAAAGPGRSTHPASFRSGYAPSAYYVPKAPEPTVPFGRPSPPTTVERVGDQLLIRRGAELTVVRCDRSAQFCVIE